MLRQLRDDMPLRSIRLISEHCRRHKNDWRKASTPSSRCSTAEWVAPQKAAVHEKTLRISHSTRERVRSIGKDGNNGSQGQTTRHEQVAGSTLGPECPLPRRVERIQAPTQRAVGGGGR